MSTSTKPPSTREPSQSRSMSSTAPRRSSTRRGLLYVTAALAGLLLLGLVGLALTGALSDTLRTLRGAPSVTGLALIPEARGAAAYNLANGVQNVLIPAPPDGWVGAVDATRDGRRIVAQVYEPPQEGSIGISSLVVAEGSGGSGTARVLAKPDKDEFFAEPRWSPDGASVFFTRRLTRKPSPGEPKQRIERLDVTSGKRTVVVDNASAPDPTPDGQTLVFLRDDGQRLALSSAPILANGAAGPVRDLVPSQAFEGMVSPIVSPDGHQIVVGFVDSTPSAAAADPLAALGNWLVPSALAHGVPWDLYVLPVDGSSPPKRLTNFRQDSPFPAWSPDGRWLLARAEYNEFLVDAQSGETWTLNQNGGYGGIAWVPAPG